MALHLIKLCVGADSIEDLAVWQRSRLRLSPELVHITRQTPRRPGFTAGSSLYWVIKGMVQVRQRLLGFREVKEEDGIPRCALILDPELVATERQPRRPFQGWRYLDEADAPRDLSSWEAQATDAIPPAMRRELAELCL